MIKTVSRLPGSLIVWITSYVFFLLTLADNFSASHDSIHYLNGIVKGEQLFHQHHLLYQFLAYEWLNLWSAIFSSMSSFCSIRIQPHYIIESFTAIWGSSSLAVIYLFFRNRFYLSAAPAALGIAVIAFSYGFWFYSVNIEVYAPPLFFILLCLYVLTRKQSPFSSFEKGARRDPAYGETAGEFNRVEKDVWLIAILHSLAILFHQVNVLFAVVVLYMFYKNKASVKTVIQYALTGIAITGGIYFIAGWIIEGHHSLAEWIRWMEGYTVGHGYWQPLSWKTPLHVVTGFAHAFIGGHYIFQIPFVEHSLQQSFQSHGLTDELFLSSKISAALAWMLVALTIVFVLLMISLVWRFMAKYSQMRRHYRVINPLILCILVYSVFFCFWMPEILEFWILQMVLVWMLLIGMLPLFRFPFNISLRNGLIIMSITLFVLNYAGSVRWLQDIRNDWYYHETLPVKNVLQSNDLVIVEDEWILKDFMRYFTKAQVIATDEPGYSRADAAKRVKEVIEGKGRVYLYSKGKGAFIQSY